jgi:sulfur carrier protein ThiS
MPRVQVELVGPMRRPWPESSRDLDLAVGTTVGDLLASLGYPPPQAAHLVVRVNGVKVRPGTVLGDGDRVTVILVVGGG